VQSLLGVRAASELQNTFVSALVQESHATTVARGAGVQGLKGERSDRVDGQPARRCSIRIIEASIGRGKVYLFGPEITFRGQPHGTFKFLFNGIYAPTGVPSIVP